MVSKKLVIVSSLMVASLSLSGCSSLQSMVNNKIASTAQQVGTAVNSEVVKTTDAIKQEAGEVNMKDLKTPLFLKYYGEYEGGIVRNEAMSLIHFQSGDAGLKEKFGLVSIKELGIDDCPPNPDGICAASFILYAKTSDWNKPGKQEFYFSPDSAGAPGSIYGPFTDDLQALYNEIKDINNIHISSVEEIKNAIAKDGQVYTNKEFGFSLQLPKSWGTIKEKVQTDKDGKTTFITLTSEDGKYSHVLDIYTTKIEPMESGLNYVGVSGNNHYVFASYGGIESNEEDDNRNAAIASTFKAIK